MPRPVGCLAAKETGPDCPSKVSKTRPSSVARRANLMRRPLDRLNARALWGCPPLGAGDVVTWCALRAC